MHIASLLAAVVGAVYLAGTVRARAVFAHYMIGTVTDAHAHQDIDDAIAMGLDAFALNMSVLPLCL